MLRKGDLSTHNYLPTYLPFIEDFYCVCRLANTLSQMMNSTGYKEKAPANIQEDDIKKLNSYMEELKIIGEAEKDLEHMIDGQK